MTPRSPSLVAIGPWDHAEFAALRAEVDPYGEWGAIDSLEALTDAMTGGCEETLDEKNAAATLPFVPLPPELILLAQPRPDLTLPAQLERLRTAAPLVRVVVVAGTWCEGELRTGTPPAGVVRLYWYEFAAWWRAAIAQWQSQQLPPWSEPLDDVRAGQQTAISRDVQGGGWPAVQHERAPGDRGLLAIDAVDFAVFETLAMALAPCGWRCEWQPRHRPELISGARFVGAIWDGGQFSDGELKSLQALAARLRAINPAVAVIALLDFPRVEHLQAACDAGAAAVLGKPYQVAQLANELDRLMGVTV